MRKSITSIRDPLKWKQDVYNQSVEVVSLVAQRNVEFPLWKFPTSIEGGLYQGKHQSRAKDAME